MLTLILSEYSEVYGLNAFTFISSSSLKPRLVQYNWVTSTIEYIMPQVLFVECNFLLSLEYSFTVWPAADSYDHSSCFTLLA